MHVDLFQTWRCSETNDGFFLVALLQRNVCIFACLLHCMSGCLDSLQSHEAELTMCGIMCRSHMACSDAHRPVLHLNCVLKGASCR